MKITVDPNTDASGFGYADAGRYTLRVKAAEIRKKEGSEHNYIRWEIEFADPNVKLVKEGSKVGAIFENTTLKPGDNAQFRLRQLSDALGMTWGDFDTEDTIGREFEAEVGIKEYNGQMSNEIKKYIPVKK